MFNDENNSQVMIYDLRIVSILNWMCNQYRSMVNANTLSYILRNKDL